MTVLFLCDEDNLVLRENAGYACAFRRRRRPEMTILVLCREDNLCNALADYARAFRRAGVQLVCAPRGFPLNGDLRELLRLCPETPVLILHPESDFPLMPLGITETEIPTACFQVDTYAYSQRRMTWSMLFDYPVVFHPEFDDRLRRKGHPCPLLFPHAVEYSYFAGGKRERVFEVGWVGQAKGPLYKQRARLLPELARLFRMNDWRKHYTAADMAEVYKQSKIVVNIGRDDYPQDANLRTFEAMAAGALLLTSLPTELTQFGFEDGQHFLGFRTEEEIVPLARKYLADEPSRQRIAESAREMVLREHTYDVRVQTLLDYLERDAGKLCAPARHWSQGRARLAYLDFFAANGVLDCAAAELRNIAQQSLRNTARGTVLLARAVARAVYSRLAFSFRRGRGNQV